MTNDHEGILKRLEKLERQNRRMKLAGLAAVVIAGAFALMGQAGRVHPSTITATGFVLVDAQGRERATLEARGGLPQFSLYDEKGNLRVLLNVATNGDGLVLLGADGKQDVTLIAAGGSQLWLGSAEDKSSVFLGASSGGPAVQIKDPAGYETHIGVTDLITPATGETHKTSAASIVLFGKNKKVLWSAPPQN